jgi:GNAT superfamily N-acetyltransferase
MIIRELFEEERPLVLDFFLRLGASDRYRRFGRPMTDDAVSAYVAGLDWTDSVILGAFDRDAELAGLLELADVRDGAEIAVVVHQRARGQGLGRALMDRALLKAKVRGSQRVVLLCQMDNEPMRRLARSAGLKAHVEDGEVEGSLTLAHAKITDRTEDATHDVIGNVSYAGLVTTRAWADLFESVFNVPRRCGALRGNESVPERQPAGAPSAAAPARLPNTRLKSPRPAVR